jgi:Cu-Zn family superoxide dismutase
MKPSRLLLLTLFGLSVSVVALAAGAHKSARATLLPTQGNTVAGNVQFKTVATGVEVTATVTGLVPGSTHAIHVHEKGNCEAADASSAGGHFNPGKAEHGDPTASEHHKHHAGDLPNLLADDKGSATLSFVMKGVSLATGRADDLLLRSVIVHAGPDDYATQPSGNSGARLACGVIQ